MGQERHDTDHALIEAVDQILSSPESASARLARGVVQGKSSPQGPVTRESVAAAIEEELDLEGLGLSEAFGASWASFAATLMVKKVRAQLGKEATA